MKSVCPSTDEVWPDWTTPSHPVVSSYLKKKKGQGGLSSAELSSTCTVHNIESQGSRQKNQNSSACLYLLQDVKSSSENPFLNVQYGDFFLLSSPSPVKKDESNFSLMSTYWAFTLQQINYIARKRASDKHEKLP